MSGPGPGAAAFALRVAAVLDLPRSPVAAPDVEGGENHVVVLGAGAGRVVVRFPRPGRNPDFALEAWCAERARRCAVATAEVLWTGRVEGVAVQVQRYVPDPGGAGVPRLERWRVLGDLARRTAAVPLGPDAPAGLFSRFGRDLPAAWRAHVDSGLAGLVPGDPLVALGAYEPDDAAPLRDLLAEARELPLRFGLAHGDPSPRNLRVGAGGEPVLLDWGSAAAGPVPATDLLHLLGGRSRDGEPDDAAVAAFLDGWGEPVDPRAIALVRLVGALDLVRWALERAPGRVERQVAAARREVRRQLHE